MDLPLDPYPHRKDPSMAIDYPKPATTPASEIAWRFRKRAYFAGVSVDVARRLTDAELDRLTAERQARKRAHYDATILENRARALAIKLERAHPVALARLARWADISVASGAIEIARVLVRAED